MLAHLDSRGDRWLTPLVDLGSSRPLQHEDLFQVAHEDEGRVLVEDFERFWQAEQRAASEELREPSLPRAIWRRHGGRYAIYSLLMVVWCVAL